jgi:hypothetical protein
LPSARVSFPSPRLGAGLLVLVLAAIWVPHLGSELVYDAHNNITRNPEIGRPLPWVQVFGSDFTQHVRGPGHGSGYTYRPLTWLQILAVGRVWGTSPWAHHLATWALHLVLCLGLYALLLGLGCGPPLALGLALLMGLHPAHIEPVLGMPGAEDPLAGLGIAAAVGILGLWQRRGPAGTVCLAQRALECLGLGLATLWACLGKEIGGPAVVVLVLAWVGLPGPRPRVGPLVATGLGLAAYLALRSLALPRFGQEGDFLRPEAWPLLLRGLFYPGMAALPLGFVPLRDLAAGKPLLPSEIVQILLGSVVVGAALASSWRRTRPLLILAAWWGVTLGPALLFTLNSGVTADRYLYLPLAGTLVWLGHRLATAPPLPAPWRKAGWALLVAYLLVLGTMASIDARAWHGEGAFWFHVLEANPRSPAGPLHIGRQLLERGHPAEAEGMLREGLRRGCEHPDAVWNDLGVALAGMGRDAEALEAFRTSYRIRTDPQTLESIRRLEALLGDSNAGPAEPGPQAP